MDCIVVPYGSGAVCTGAPPPPNHSAPATPPPRARFDWLIAECFERLGSRGTGTGLPGYTGTPGVFALCLAAAQFSRMRLLFSVMRAWLVLVWLWCC